MNFLNYNTQDIYGNCINIAEAKLVVDLFQLTNFGGLLIYDSSIIFYPQGSQYSSSTFNSDNIKAYLLNLDFKLDANIYLVGADIFGNQFGICNENLYFINIETNEIELLANKILFSSIINIIDSDFKYFSGIGLKQEFEKKNNTTLGFHRLVPIKPFAIGGEFEVENLYALDFFKTLSYNCNLAKQFRSIPDGEYVKIVVEK